MYEICRSRNSAGFDNIDYHPRLYLRDTKKNFANSLHDLDAFRIRVKLKTLTDSVIKICYTNNTRLTMVASEVQTISDNCKFNVWIKILATILILFTAKYIHSGIVILTSLLLTRLILIILHRYANSNHPLLVAIIIYLIMAIMVAVDAFTGTDIPIFHSYSLCIVIMKDNSVYP